jgi:hypothetical protein
MPKKGVPANFPSHIFPAVVPNKNLRFEVAFHTQPLFRPNHPSFTFPRIARVDHNGNPRHRCIAVAPEKMTDATKSQ